MKKTLFLLTLLSLLIGCQRDKANEIGVGYNKSLIIPPTNDLPAPGSTQKVVESNQSSNPLDSTGVDPSYGVACPLVFSYGNTVTFYEGVLETLELLKQEYILGVVTNGNADLKVIGIDYFFDYIFSAADLNAHKPDPIMFEAVINKTKLKPHEICHIGDHPLNDVKASLDFGMTPVWFNEEKTEFPIEGIQIAEFSDWYSLPELIKNL